MNGRFVAMAVVAGLVVAGCDGEDGTGPTSTTSTSTSKSASTSSSTAAPVVPIGAIAIRAEKVAALSRPTALATRPGDERLYVAEQAGRVMAVAPGHDPELVLDISDDVHQPEGDFDEQGLLGLAIAPRGSFLYVNYTNRAGDTRIVEFAMRDTGPDPASRRDVLGFDQPYANHNGGALAFGPDGFLYISLGDGGSGGDPHGNGQSLGTLLGKILRINPRPTDGAAYGIPPDNPFGGRQGARPEIWAYGLRNPWRISFDRRTGDLWIGDVGQDEVEEIDFQPASSDGGENYGWNRLEGSRPFEGDPPAEHVLPIHEYPTSDGCAVTGGYVYRGTALPPLQGVYLFSDTCNGELMGLRRQGGKATEVAALGVQLNLVSSFGEDENGELYVLSLTDGLFRIVAA